MMSDITWAFYLSKILLGRRSSTTKCDIQATPRQELTLINLIFVVCLLISAGGEVLVVFLIPPSLSAVNPHRFLIMINGPPCNEALTKLRQEGDLSGPVNYFNLRNWMRGSSVLYSSSDLTH